MTRKSMAQGKKVFIIRPVRNVTQEVRNKVAIYVAALETWGYEVYDPEKNNPYQETDTIGMQILDYNCRNMVEADEVHIWWDTKSAGSVYDIGMFFMFVRISDFKKFVIINGGDIAPTPHKSFENVILALAKEFNSPVADGLKEKWGKYNIVKHKL